MVLQTQRAVLEPLRQSDAKELLVLFRDPEVRRYLLDDAVVDRDWVTREIVNSTRRHQASGTGLWAARKNATSPIFGFAGFRPFFDPPELQLLYGLLPRYWGRGLGTEIARAVRDYGFRQLGLTLLSAATDVPNRASVRVLERLGMRVERETGDGIHGTVFFVLSRTDWEQTQTEPGRTQPGPAQS